MTIIDNLLKEIKSEDYTDQIRELCDQIQKEEIKNTEHALYIPKGPNVFLSVEVPGRYKNEIAFLTLERESTKEYYARLWTFKQMDLSHKKEPSPKLQRFWDIKAEKPKRVLIEYAKIVKYLRGE